MRKIGRAVSRGLTKGFNKVVIALLPPSIKETIANVHNMATGGLVPDKETREEMVKGEVTRRRREEK